MSVFPGPFLKLELALVNFLDKSLFFLSCHETRKRFFTMTYCLRRDLSRFVSFFLTGFSSSLRSFWSFYSFLHRYLFAFFFVHIIISFFFVCVDIQDEHFPTFDNAVSIKSVMRSRFFFFSFWSMAYVPHWDLVERDWVAVFAKNLRHVWRVLVVEWCQPYFSLMSFLRYVFRGFLRIICLLLDKPLMTELMTNTLHYYIDIYLILYIILYNCIIQIIIAGYTSVMLLVNIAKALLFWCKLIRTQEFLI